MATLRIASALTNCHAAFNKRSAEGNLAQSINRKDIVQTTELSHRQRRKNIQCRSVAPQYASESTTKQSVHQPNIWDYCLIESLTSDFQEETYAEQVNKLKEEVGSLIFKEERLSNKIELLSEIERLGLGNHFENEMKGVLSSIQSNGILESFPDDLYHTALAFRLLRSQGIQTSEDVFDSFKDGNGDFKSIFSTNVFALLSLYEASHLALEGEIKLDEARCFATKGLNDLRLQMEPHLEQKVVQALEYPLHWRPAWIEARSYIDECKQSIHMNHALLRLAKLNFNIVQRIHLQDLKNTIRWWKEEEISKKLTFARERIVECFYAAVGCVSDPRFGVAREEITKAGQLVTIVDDIYELHGTFDELELLKNTIRRWDINSAEKLPEHMKKWCSSVFNSVNQIAHKIQVEENLNTLPFLIKSWTDLLDSYFVEIEWSRTGYMPTLEEYLQNAATSVGILSILLCHLLFTEKRLTEEALECWNNKNDLVISICRIFRLSNDLGTSEEELKRGDTTKAIQCYMNDKKVCEAEAREGIRQMISETWKKLNKDVVDNCHLLPQGFVMKAVEFARTGCCLYYQRDHFGAPNDESKRQIKSLFLEPTPIT